MTSSIEIRQAIPGVLTNLEQWACRRGKLPLNPRTLAPARSNDPTTWGSFEQAARTYRRGRADGISFALREGGGLVAVDLDGCRDPTTGALSPFAVEVLAGLCSYAEVSPSGTGLHIFAAGRLPGPRRRIITAGGPIELYPDRRFMSVTGWRLPGLPPTVEERSRELAALYREVFPDLPPVHLPAVACRCTLPDDEVLRRAGRRPGFAALYAGDTAYYAGDHSRADLALCALLAGITHDGVQIDRLFRRSGLMRQKWDQPRGNGTYGSRTIARALWR